MIVETRDRALLLETVDAPFKLIHPMRPQPGPGQVLVRIHASGVNPLDTKIRAGKGAHARQALPAVLGMDLAGVVESVGEGVSNFAPGDEVYGMAGGIGGNPGTLADYQALDADLVAKKPLNLDMRQAAALPLVAITAWEGLVDRARVGAGHKVLVHGGAGGVGHVAIQIARAFGAEVYATGSAENLAVIEGFGAIAIDYRSTAVEDYVARHTDGRGFDIVYDTVGGVTLDASFQAVRHYTGHVVSALGWGEHKLAPLSFRGATYSGVFTLLPLLTGEGRKHHGEILAKVASLVEDGKLKVRLDPQRFSLEEALDAYRLVASGDAKGKVVVDLVG
ncbi:quinone oxidoreductase [Pseudomonas sp. BN415]|uniref:zinc-dependent alcohol dehydrogenase family protein n=1 Tax=Pseudomonas sp. BN415 TaxID=2567889 RepID=UPI002453DD9D|nr:zinc-dependent alcohol dehydrogenase family protein [Pseudomonas sp. BN415]MDH4580576.1 quinone oxidoreductase [Pseudomonas sp. BN415]